jgi:hypothetical protein
MFLRVAWLGAYFESAVHPLSVKITAGLLCDRVNMSISNNLLQVRVR